MTDPSTAIESCKNCKFCRAATTQAVMQFYCALNPPQAVTVPTQRGELQTFAIQPPLPPTRYCGSWKASGRPDTEVDVVKPSGPKLVTN